MLTKVDPLRNELQSLEIEAQASRIKVMEEYRVQFSIQCRKTKTK